MKRQRADGLQIERVEHVNNFVYCWRCVYTRRRTRLVASSTTRFGAMREAVRSSNEALAHELATELRDRGRINWP
jgi:hypothetical protein